MSVQEYLDKHLLSRKIEDAVNAAVRAKASDPVLFISNHMRKAVPPVITKIKARQILDSRGIPTVEVDLYTNKGMSRASVPSGASAGMYEAVELRDGDKGKYLGKGVLKAVNMINEKISEALIGMDPLLQVQIDQAMMDLDKTEYKVPLYKHIADLSGKSNPVLPVPAITVISGGKHAENNLAVQEIMILPVGANSFQEAMQMGSETYHHLKVHYDVSRQLKIFLLLSGKKYDLDFKTPGKSGQDFKTGEDMLELYTKLCTEYPIVSIEQPFDKEDWEHTKLFSALGLCQVVGDDLLMSNPKRIERAVNEFTCNALLLKLLRIEEEVGNQAIYAGENWKCP
ncbi:hypothetical protein C4D60_Mb06t15680 [Musa balbisiana]|uniref:phosphopyruvate hydratase n=1 Tax=Musa balbisiana TaxID=52838 RepID=A0A4S8INA5_MUSBA|nr:hypothetical protein C4D60_Mb06t15680 [Musa balbisiana]